MKRTLLTVDQTAARINRSPNTLRYWRRVGEGPISFRVGRRVVYDADDVDAWIDAQREASVSGVDLVGHFEQGLVPPGNQEARPARR